MSHRYNQRSLGKHGGERPHCRNSGQSNICEVGLAAYFGGKEITLGKVTIKVFCVFIRGNAWEGLSADILTFLNGIPRISGRYS